MWVKAPPLHHVMRSAAKMWMEAPHSKTLYKVGMADLTMRNDTLVQSDDFT
jgi:hypothetical protein